MSTLDASRRLDAIAPTLDAAGQGHLVAWCEQLDAAARERLLDEIEAIDLGQLARLVAGEGLAGSGGGGDLEPVDAVLPEGAAAEAARDRGESLLRAGKVAAFTVAGGQGTRLGWRGPKGTFPATVVTGKPLFRLFAEQILATQERFGGVEVPWYLMTSPANDGETQSFFRDNNFFGLSPAQVSFLVQGTMPAVDLEGRLLLEAPDRLALSPDGHGGSLRALRASGSLEEMRARGIEQISYFQVDNPLVRILDPVFIGLHAGDPRSSGEMSGKMVPKRDAGEKVGVFCRRGGRVEVVEYSDLPAALATATDPQGRLLHRAGNIAVHLISTAFVERLTEDPAAFGLPFHRALKKVPCIDLASGRPVEPTAPNGIKFETFVFDAMPLAARSLVMETSRREEFAPIKNATGEDSAESSRQAQSDRAAAWLESRGVEVAKRPDGTAAAKIEIQPRTALCAADLATHPLPDRIDPGAEVVI